MAAIGNMSVDELFFYGAFCLYSIAEIIRTTAFVMTFPILGTICHGLLILSALLLLMRLMLLRASDFQWLVTLGIFMLTALVAFRYGMEYPFWIFLFVISGKGIKIKRLAKITLVLATVITVSAILACYAGFVENYTMIATGDRVLRNSMGFLHPNRLGERIAEICISYWYLRVSDHRLRVTVLYVVSFLFVYFVANSRTSCLVFVVLILGTWFFPLLSKVPRFSVILCGILITLTISASFFFMASYDSFDNLMTSLNELLSGRLYLMNFSYRFQAPSLFGNDYSNAPVVGFSIASNSEYHFQVDNAYGHLLLLYGLIPTILFLILIFLIYVKFYRDGKFPLALFGLSILLVVGLVENFTLDIQYNYFLLLISDIIFVGKEASAPERRTGRSSTMMRLAKAQSISAQRPSSYFARQTHPQITLQRRSL